MQLLYDYEVSPNLQGGSHFEMHKNELASKESWQREVWGGSAKKVSLL